ncbi:MAG: AAA family ATPase [Nitrospinae bacterium]|nr:AAA family ATPase [Nitrospinota bacterium]
MKVLADVRPTPEQLPIIRRNTPGTVLIRGAAGSGKTTTALLRLRSLISSWINRRERLEKKEQVCVLVLTFNRTLSGYIHELAKGQIKDLDGLELDIFTFSKWAVNLLRKPSIVNDKERFNNIKQLGSNISLDPDFIVDEVEYVIGRFLPEKLDDYLNCRRDGRGIFPRVDKNMRENIINDIIYPYNKWKLDMGKMDWNDLAVKLARIRIGHGYDVIISDEVQDFSANQIRAIKNQLKEDHSLTFVLDAAQRIYPRGFTWIETGLTIKSSDTYRLSKNYRNTVEIAQFAISLIKDMKIEDDGTLPDLNSCERNGPIPKVLKGKFSKQMEYVIQYIRKEVKFGQESIAFMHPMGGRWFREIERCLNDDNLQYVHITKESEWPDGNESIALSTLHSAKGLEFDYVFILGLNQEVTPHGKDERDDRLENLRRLMAMGICRARKSVVLGYKPEDASSLISFLDPNTYKEICV